jgi:hypothetical protein
MTMRAKPAVTRFLMAAVAAGAVVLAADEANAAIHSRRGQASEYQAPQFSSRRDLYESDAQGRQPYANPDRELYVPQYGY